MKPFIFILTVSVFFMYACTSGKTETQDTAAADGKGLVGYVELTDPLDEALVMQGSEIFNSKCARCHTLDTVQFAVPAFAGVTNRRSPEWIMNMIINVEQMLERDPVAADLLKKHKIEMPDPELNVEQARAVLEFLRKNDLEQVGQKDQGANSSQ